MAGLSEVHLDRGVREAIEKFWRDQRSMMITEGPGEIFKSALARRVFELYA